MCDLRAGGDLPSAEDGSYFTGLQWGPDGTCTIRWEDDPDRAVVFPSSAAAEEFRQASVLSTFAASYVPLTELPQPPVSPSPVPSLTPPPESLVPAQAPAAEQESEAAFQARLREIIATGTAPEAGREALERHAAGCPQCGRAAARVRMESV